jgi:hypothetical protein
MDQERKDRIIVWNGEVINCDFCRRLTTLGACNLWGDFALCEGCDALMTDKYNFDMMLEPKERENRDLRTAPTSPDELLAR